jgi:hypothetical protein
MEIIKTDNFYEASGAKKKRVAKRQAKVQKRVEKRIAKKTAKGKKIPKALQKRYKNIIAKRKGLIKGAKTKKGFLKALALGTVFGIGGLGIAIAKKIKRNRAAQNKVLISKKKKPIPMTAPVTTKEQKLAVASVVASNPEYAPQIIAAAQANPAIAAAVPTPQEVQQYGQQEMASQEVEEQYEDVAAESQADDQIPQQEVAEEYVEGEEEAAVTEDVPTEEDVDSGATYGEEEYSGASVDYGNAAQMMGETSSFMGDDQIAYDIDNQDLRIDEAGANFADGDGSETIVATKPEITFSADADFFYAEEWFAADGDFQYAKGAARPAKAPKPKKDRKPFKDTKFAGILGSLAAGVAANAGNIISSATNKSGGTGGGMGAGEGTYSETPSSEKKPFPIVPVVGIVVALVVVVGGVMFLNKK